jgi:hypothetical protein
MKHRPNGGLCDVERSNRGALRGAAWHRSTHHGVLVGEAASMRMCNRTRKERPTLAAFMNINGRHFWGRANSATRYDPENCDGICGGCHMRHEGNKQGLYREKKIAQLGQDRYEALFKRAHSIVKRADAIRTLMGWINT